MTSYSREWAPPFKYFPLWYPCQMFSYYDTTKSYVLDELLQVHVTWVALLRRKFNILIHVKALIPKNLCHCNQSSQMYMTRFVRVNMKFCEVLLKILIWYKDFGKEKVLANQVIVFSIFFLDQTQSLRNRKFDFLEIWMRDSIF